MAHSGIVAEDAIFTAFKDLKSKSGYRYLICRVSDDKTKVVLDEKGDRSKTFADFVKALPEKECRYAVIDYEYEHESQSHDRICFVMWTPDTAPTRDKMLVASSSSAVLKKFGNGIHRKFQAADKGDLEEEEFKHKCITGHS